MRPFIIFVAISLLSGIIPIDGESQQTAPSRVPTYERDVVPILHTYCIVCHDSLITKGGLDMESYESLMKGGEQGAVIVPGKSGESLLILMVEGKVQPKMPFQGDSPTDSEIAVIKAWIDAGAKKDGGQGSGIRGQLKEEEEEEEEKEKDLSDPRPPTPDPQNDPQSLKPKVPVKGQIGSVVFSPDGNLLAAGSYQEVTLIDVATGKTGANLKDHAGAVNAVAFSPDGKILAAAGGAPKQFGELKIWDVETRTLITTLREHRDSIYSISFSPDGKKLVAASYDRLVSLWDISGVRGQRSGVSEKNEKNEKSDPRTPNPESRPLMLKDHTDSVYSVAFSPDGKLVASASGDRTVKVWNSETGQRIYTLSEATAELYSVTFHPSGKKLAAAGVDKMIRIWSVSETAGKLELSAFAHDGAILHLLYSPDGENLFTCGEDGLVKVWHPDPSQITEKKVFEKQDDWPLALALNKDGSRLAVGRYDGSLSLYDVASGNRLLEPLRPAAKAKEEPKPGAPFVVPAALRSVSPPGVVRGSTVELILEGSNLNEAMAVFFDEAEITGEILGVRGQGSGVSEKTEKTDLQPPTPDVKHLKVEATIAPNARIGIHKVFIQTPLGTTGSVSFAVGDWLEIGEAESNNSIEGAPKVFSLPVTIIGSMNQVGDADYYQFDAEAGQEIVFQVVASPIRSKLNSVLTLMDSKGTILAENNDYDGQVDSLIGYSFKTSERYTIQVKDFENSGGKEFYYRLNIGAFPYLTHAFPLGIRKGTSPEVTVYGFNLENVGAQHAAPNKAKGEIKLEVKAPEATDWGKTIPISAKTSNGANGESINQLKLAIGEHPEIMEEENRKQETGNREKINSNDDISNAQWVDIPVTINGRIYREDSNQSLGAASSAPTTPPFAFRPSPFLSDVDYYRFRARKGEKLTIEVAARRLGSPLDSVIEVLDARGQPIERATLRCLSETYLVLSDRDSASTGFRLQSWTDLALNDYVYCGDELLRVARLPLGPDEDVAFQSFRGQRLGFLDTTPRAHALNESVYKVQLHPPGKNFPPNGMPIFRIYSRNDDGGPLYGKDSKITFDAPDDGEYIVKITDVRGQDGERYAYRLTIRETAPDFRLTLSPEHPNVSKGSRIPITVTAERLDGFDGEIEVWMEGLPKGFSATSGAILSAETSVTLLLSADPDATTPNLPTPSSVRVVGRATISGKEVVRTIEPENGLRLITVLPSPDVTVTTDLQEVTIQPGGEARVTVKVDRHNGFGGRVPIDVKNLPFGVRVLDVGLNGVLVTEQGNSREFVLYAEPWAKPMRRLFYCVGRVESDPQTENAATPIILKVGRGESASTTSEKSSGGN